MLTYYNKAFISEQYLCVLVKNRNEYSPTNFEYKNTKKSLKPTVTIVTLFANKQIPRHATAA
jgi:hypothetical protein